jgi:hypothetical protein
MKIASLSSHRCIIFESVEKMNTYLRQRRNFRNRYLQVINKHFTGGGKSCKNLLRKLAVVLENALNVGLSGLPQERVVYHQSILWKNNSVSKGCKSIKISEK